MPCAPTFTAAAAYGWSDDLTDDAILARLLALNLERAVLKPVDAALFLPYSNM
jgi:hypothetical protein